MNDHELYKKDVEVKSMNAAKNSHIKTKTEKFASCRPFY